MARCYLICLRSQVLTTKKGQEHLFQSDLKGSKQSAWKMVSLILVPLENKNKSLKFTYPITTTDPWWSPERHDWKEGDNLEPSNI